MCLDEIASVRRIDEEDMHALQAERIVSMPSPSSAGMFFIVGASCGIAPALADNYLGGWDACESSSCHVLSL